MTVGEALTDGTSILFRVLNDTHYSNHTDTHHADAHGEHTSGGTDVLLTIIIFLLLGTLLRFLIKHFESPLPYTVCLLIVSFLWGLFFEGVKDLHDSLSWTPLGALGNLSNGTDILIGIDPHLFLMVFIPPLIFESSFSVNYHTFTMVQNQALILAGPGVLISSLMAAALAMLLFGWTFLQSLMFGAIISATDPVAVVALLRDLGASKKLATLIEGESLLNDGTAVVLYFIVAQNLGIVEGINLIPNLPSVIHILWEFVYRAIGGCMWGIMAGWIIGVGLGSINDDFLIETSLTFAGAIWCFWGGYWMGVSDILAVVAFGLYLSKNETLISPHAQHALHYIWEWLAYVANTLIFELTGVIVATTVKQHFDWNDLWKNLLLYLGLNLIRLVTIGICFPATRKMGYGVAFEDVVVQVVGALRGAIGLAVAMLTVLQVQFNAQGDEELERLAQQILLHTCLIVVWTLCCNAVVMPYIIRYLEMDKLTEEGQVIFHQVIQRLEVEETNLLSSMKCDHMYSATDWDTIKSIMPDFNILKGSMFQKDKKRQVTTNMLDIKKNNSISVSASASASNSRPKRNDAFKSRQSVFIKQKERMTVLVGAAKNKKYNDRYTAELSEYIHMCDASSLMVEIRQRVLATVRASYWHQFHEGMITEEVTRLLVESAEVAMDKGSLEAQWDHVSNYIIIPDYVQKLYERKIMFINYFVQWYLHEKLNIGIQLCEAFIESYQKVKSMFETFPEFADLEMAQTVVDEGRRIDEVAKLALLNLKVKYSKVYRAIKTYQAAMFILNQQRKTVKNLHNAGVMEDKECNKVIHYIEKHTFAARKLYRKAEVCNEANLAFKVFRNLPWLQHLDDDLSSELFAECEVLSYSKGEVLYTAGSDLEWIYIIVEGVLHFQREGQIIETRECGQFMGLIGVLGSDSIHANIVTGSQVVLVRIPEEQIQHMFNDETCFEGMARAAADVLINTYFQEAFGQYTSVEINYRVATGRILEIDSTVAKVNFTSEALLLKGVGSIHGTNGANLICAPALLMPNMIGYQFFEDSVIIELAREENLHGAQLDITNIKATENRLEHIQEEEDEEDDFSGNSDTEKCPSPNGRSVDLQKAQRLMARHHKSMSMTKNRNRPWSMIVKHAKPVIMAKAFHNTRNRTKYNKKVSLQDVVIKESEEEYEKRDPFKTTEMTSSRPCSLQVQAKC